MATVELGALPYDALQGVSATQLQPGDLLSVNGNWWWCIGADQLLLLSSARAEQAFRLFQRDAIRQDTQYPVVRVTGQPAVLIHSEMVGGEQAAPGMLAVVQGGLRVVGFVENAMRTTHLIDPSNWTAARRDGVTAAGAIESWSLTWTSGAGDPVVTISQRPR